MNAGQAIQVLCSLCILLASLLSLSLLSLSIPWTAVNTPFHFEIVHIFRLCPLWYLTIFEVTTYSTLWLPGRLHHRSSSFPPSSSLQVLDFTRQLAHPLTPLLPPFKPPMASHSIASTTSRLVIRSMHKLHPPAALSYSYLRLQPSPPLHKPVLHSTTPTSILPKLRRTFTSQPNRHFQQPIKESSPSPSPNNKNNTSTTDPNKSSNKKAPQNTSLLFQGLGARRGVKRVVIAFLLVIATAETVFWVKVCWAWLFPSQGKDEKEV